MYTASLSEISLFPFLDRAMDSTAIGILPISATVLTAVNPTPPPIKVFIEGSSVHYIMDVPGLVQLAVRLAAGEIAFASSDSAICKPLPDPATDWCVFVHRIFLVASCHLSGLLVGEPQVFSLTKRRNRRKTWNLLFRIITGAPERT